MEYPEANTAAPAKDRISGTISATAFGEEYRGIGPQEAVDTYVADYISTYRTENLELAESLAGEGSMALSWGKYLTGVFSEEMNVITPAIECANREGILAFGPYSPDGFFSINMQYKFDAVLAMYHDQGLIPFKALAFDSGVNFTAGLPIVRTSPDHGTAFDLAGENRANPQSMISAIYMAIDIYWNRKRYAEMNADPVKKYDME